MVNIRQKQTKPNTGQTNRRNVKSILNNPYPNQVLTKLVRKQQNTKSLSESEDIKQSIQHYNQHTDPKDNQDEAKNMSWDSTNLNRKQIMELIDDKDNENDDKTNNDALEEPNERMYDDKIIGVNFKMEISPNTKPPEQDIIALLYSKVAELIEKWISNGNIDGIYTKENYVLNSKLNDNALEWAINQRVIFQKKVIIAETYLNLQTLLKVFQLYQAVKDLCIKYHMKIEAKKSTEGFTKKMGFVVGPHVNSASTDYYANKLVASINEFSDALEIKK